MYALRWLNGSKPGQIFEIKPGGALLGRGEECHIQILDKGISKQHAQIQLLDDKLFIKDLRSTNGVFVNGVRVQQSRLRVGDKILFHQMLFDVVEIKKTAAVTPYTQPTAPMVPPPPPNFFPQTPAPQTSAQPAGNQIQVTSLGDLGGFLDTYVNKVIVPGFYKLAENLEFRLVLGGVVGVYIFMVTFLAAFPMMNITKSSVESESRRRALTLARYLQGRNQQAINQGIETGLDTDLAREEGVKTALIVAASDGHIMAPASKVGKYENIPFIQEARKKDQEITEQIDSSTIGAAAPLRSFNAETGVQSIVAYSVVIYDMGTLAVDEGRIISLFVQVLAIASALGLLIFLILYKMIEYPIDQLNEQLDVALKENGNNDIKTTFQFPALIDLTSNINSALARINSSSSGANMSGDKQTLQLIELENLSQLMSGALLILEVSTQTIQSVNPYFENLTGLSLNAVQNQPLDVIVDQALKLNLQDLFQRSLQQVGAPVSDQLEIGGNYYDIICQSLSVGGQPSHVIACIRPKEAA